MTTLLPSPGQGPDQAAREAGHFQIQLLGLHPDRAASNLQLRIRGEQDPGYGATARMLGEAAVCLAQDGLSSPGGVLTPAVAMGDALIDRLDSNADVSFTTLQGAV